MSDEVAPQPREGWPGLLDRVIGPGASRAEWVLNVVPALIAALLAPLYAWVVDVHWHALLYVVAGLLALDMVGGVVTNATASGRRWYHRPGLGWGAQLGFVGMHLLHLLLVSWLFLSWDPFWVVAAGGWLLFAAVAILGAAAPLRRPLAMLAYVIALLLALFVLPQPEGLEWFLPLFYLKLLVSHLSGA